MNLVEQFPWETGMNYMAVDSDGEVCQYESEPIQDDQSKSWDISEYGDPWVIVATIDLPQDVKWYDTLVKRESEVTVTDNHFTPTNDQLDLLVNVAERHIRSSRLTGITREGILSVIRMYEQLKNK